MTNSPMPRSRASTGPWIRRLIFITSVAITLSVVLALTVSRRLPGVQHLQTSTTSGTPQGDPTSHLLKSCDDTPTSFRLPAPKEHVYYLKTHKTGSTTIYSILAEYCRTHELLPLLPRQIHINLSPPFRPAQVLLAPSVLTYDMVFSHHIFTPQILKYLPNDTFLFTTLREPFSQMVSSFQYFKREGQMRYLNNIKGNDPVRKYLSNHLKYEAKGYSSYTNNRQSMDLGYDLRHSFADKEYIKRFIQLTDKRFDLVLISDYFHESLIILKRALRWNTRHILYYRKNARAKQSKFEQQNTSMTIARQLHAQFSLADISLYDFFLKKFKQRMAQEPNLQEEVAEFENVLEKVHAFCDRRIDSLNRIDVKPGRWTDHVTVLRSKCQWLKMGEVEFTRHLQLRQKELFQTS